MCNLMFGFVNKFSDVRKPIANKGNLKCYLVSAT